MAEYTRGDWSEAQLRGKLLELIEGGTLATPIDSPASSWRGSTEAYTSSAGGSPTRVEHQAKLSKSG